VLRKLPYEFHIRGIGVNDYYMCINSA